MKPKNVYLSLGSNQGDSLDYLLQAVLALAKGGICIRDYSSIYQTEPIGYTAQADFLNMVIRGETRLEPLELLCLCQDIEGQMGRIRSLHWGPRPIDIDILFIAEENIQQELLTVPHPRLRERAFVLVPLREISPTKFAQLAVAMPEQKISLLLKRTDVTIMLQNQGFKL